MSDSICPDTTILERHGQMDDVLGTLNKIPNEGEEQIPKILKEENKETNQFLNCYSKTLLS